MKLFLASEAKHPESMVQLQAFMGESFSRKKMLYIPTAANGESWGSWRDGGSFKLVQTLGVNLNIVELESTTEESLISMTKDTDIIWFAGGMPGYLLYWLRRRKFQQWLPQLLDRGAIYVGSSAGSMVCSRTQNVIEWYIGEEEPGASVIPGLGLVDFEIYPHYEESLLPKIQEQWKSGTLYLLKNGEAITVVDGKVTVLGEERKIEK